MDYALPTIAHSRLVDSLTTLDANLTRVVVRYRMDIKYPDKYRFDFGTVEDVSEGELTVRLNMIGSVKLLLLQVIDSVDGKYKMDMVYNNQHAVENQFGVNMIMTPDVTIVLRRLSPLTSAELALSDSFLQDDPSLDVKIIIDLKDLKVLNVLKSWVH